jgi:SAM-dependent methyltransferase
MEEALSPDYRAVNDELSSLNVQFMLSDHSDLNARHYPWAADLYPKPQVYATRMWEYPFAILSASMNPGLVCADIGCGMTPFTVYLAKTAKCDVTGFDPDIFVSGERFKVFGVSQEFQNRSGLKVVRAGMDCLPVPDSSFDRVFCISVMEHVPSTVARRGMREIARVLKPGGLAILTVDTGIFRSICDPDPMALIWESGLLPHGDIQLRWPLRRLGVGYKEGEPSDVFGFVLRKESYQVETSYSGPGGVLAPACIPGHMIPWVRRSRETTPEPLRWRSRLKEALLLLLNGSRRHDD